MAIIRDDRPFAQDNFWPDLPFELERIVGVPYHMDEHFVFLIDASTIAGLLILSLYNFRSSKGTTQRVSKRYSSYFSLYTLGLAAYIFFRSTLEILCRGNVLPSLYLEFFWYDNLSLPGVVAGGCTMIFSSFKILESALDFTRRQKRIGLVVGVFAPILFFAWSLTALWMGQNWYIINHMLINVLYLLFIASLSGLAVYALIKNKYHRSLSLYLIVVTLLAVLAYLSIAQTVNFSFNTIVLGVSSVWLTILMAGQSPMEAPIKPVLVDARLEKLSASQKKVAELLLAGLEYKEIASELGLSLSAVKRRIHGIYQKFGVENRTEFFLSCKTFR